MGCKATNCYPNSIAAVLILRYVVNNNVIFDFVLIAQRDIRVQFKIFVFLFDLLYHFHCLLCSVDLKCMDLIRKHSTD